MPANLIESGVAYGLVAMVGWGVGDFFAALLARRMESLRALLWVTLIGIALVTTFVALAGPPVSWVPIGVGIAVLGGGLNTVGAIAFMTGLRLGKVSLVSPIAAGYAAVLVVAAVLLLGERLTALQLVAVTLVLAGSLLASIDLPALRRLDRPSLSDPGLPYAFAAMFSWGFGFLALAVATRYTGWVTTTLVAAGAEVLLLLAIARTAGRPMGPPVGRRLLGLATLAAGFSWLANVAYTIGVQTHLAAVVAPVSAAFPIVSLLLARLFLHERLHGWQAAGIALVIAGVVLVSV